MSCSRALLSAYHDGTLAPAERQQVQAHLRECPACQAMLHDYQALRRALAALPRYAAPAGLWGDLHAQLAAQRLRSAPGPRRSLLVAAAAAAAVLLIAAVAGGPQAPRLGEPSPARPVVAFALPQDQMTDVPPEAVIEIRFNAPVDREAVQQSLNVSPAVAARLEWQQDKMRIVPDQHLDPDTTYTISVGPMPQKPAPVLFSLRTSQAPPQAGDSPDGNGAQAPVAGRTPLAAASLPKTTSPSPQLNAAAPAAATAVVHPLAATLPCPVAPGPRSRRLAPLQRVESLGCPRGPEQPSTVTAQPFEGGLMLWIAALPSVYVLEARTGAWEARSTGAQQGSNLAANGDAPQAKGAPAAAPEAVAAPAQTPGEVTATAPPAGPHEGWRRITALWLQEPALRKALGLPTGKDLAAAASVQVFERGMVIGLPDATYLLRDDRSWRVAQERPDAPAQIEPPLIAP